MLLGRAKRHRAFEVRECRGVIPDREQCRTDELMALRIVFLMEEERRVCGLTTGGRRIRTVGPP
jgi:hypothetical protein